MAKKRRLPRYLQRELDESRIASTPQPVRRIPADISRQAPHTSMGGVPLEYLDREFECERCGQREVWTAEQQKWWYETAKGSIYTTAVRCRACREELRAAHGGTPRRSHQERREGTADPPSGRG